MRKKLIGVAASVMTLAMALGGLTACVDDNEHVHEYTEWAHNDTQHWRVCEVDGAESTHVDHFFNPVNDYACECGAQHTHVYEWKHNAEYHWQECADGFKTRKEAHSFNDDGVCECGETMAMTEVGGSLKIYRDGALENDYTGVALTLTDAIAGTEVKINSTLNTDGTYSFKVPQSEKAYTLTISKDGYVSDSIAFDATNGALREAKLVYIAYASTPGMETWGESDYSQLDKNIIRLNNDMQFIFSKDTYNKVAFSVVLQKDWNSNGGNGTQGVIFRFKDGDAYKGVAAMQTEGEKFLRNDGQADYGKYWAQQGVGLNGSLDLAEGGNWDELVNFSNRTDFKDALNAGTLKLTVLRDGAMFYAYLNDEYVGCKSYAAKYADMACEAGFYYFGFKGATTRDWHFELIEDTAELEEKIPAGSLSSVVKIKKNGIVTPLAEGEKVKVEGGGLNKEVAVENGKVTLSVLVPGTYKFSVGDDYTASIEVEKDKEYTSNIVLQYKRFELLKGWDEAQHDFSHVNDENPTIGNNGKTLNVISRDSYNDVATSLWIKKGNSTHVQDVQGIVIKFSDGSYMVTRCEKMSDGNYKLQWVKDIWEMKIAKAQWLDYQQPMTETQNTAFESADGLRVTVVRSGNILTVYVNGEKVSGGTVVLDESYATMTAQVGFFAYNSKADATWKFDIESEISAYNTALEKIGNNEIQYNNNVKLAGDVWQAMKVKVNAGYTGEVRIGFTAWHNGASKGYVKSINYNNGVWKLQETDSWNEVKLSEEFVNALTGDGLYLAYHRDVATGYVKIYAGATKAALESAIESGTAVSTFTAESELKKNEITVVGVIFWKGDYTASATGYSYGDTAAAVLAKL